jgi:MATE family multidrug resistance protein
MASASRSVSSWRERPLAELIRLSWPIAVSQLSFSLMTAVDTLFVGRLGAAALAGVALAGVAVFTSLCFGVGLLRSSKILIAQAVGAGRLGSARAYLGVSLSAAFGLGLVTALIGQAVALILPLVAASGESGRYASMYASIRMLGAPIVLVGVALRESRHGLGDARTPMIATLVANVANVGLVALFMLAWDAGVAGVAWATTLAQLIEVSVLAQLQFREGFGLRAWSLADLRKLLDMGLPLGLERFLDVASFGLMIALFARMGDVDLAAHQVTHQMLLFVFTPSMAIGDATCVLIGQAVGAASYRTVPRVQRAALVASYAYVAACCGALLLFGSELASAFSQDAAVISRSEQLFRVAAVFLLWLPFYQVGQSSLRGMGDVRYAATTTVVAAWVCTPLFAAVFGISFGLGAPGGWMGLGLEIAVAAGAFWWRLRAGGGARWLLRIAAGDAQSQGV